MQQEYVRYEYTLDGQQKAVIDANGNRTSLRKRDGRGIAYAYDELNRLMSKTYPNGGARAVQRARPPDIERVRNGGGTSRELR